MIEQTPEFLALQARNPVAATIAIEVDKMATDAVQPLLDRFERDRWPPDCRAVVVEAVMTKLFANLQGNA